MTKRGLATVSVKKRKAIAAMGGRKAHQMGRAHEWTSETAKIAGKKGGEKRRANKSL